MNKFIYSIIICFLSIQLFAQTICPPTSGTSISGSTNISSAGTYYVSSGSTWTGGFQNIANVNSGQINIIICDGGTWDAGNLTSVNPNVPLNIEVAGTLSANNLDLNDTDITIANYGDIDVVGNFKLNNILFNNYPTGSVMAVDIIVSNADGGSKNEGALVASNFIEIAEGDFDNSGSISAPDIYLHSSGFTNEASGTITSTATDCNDPSQNCGLWFGTKNSPIVNLGIMTAQYFGVSSNNSIDVVNSTGTIEVGTEVTCPDQNSLWDFFCSIGDPASLVYNSCNANQPNVTEQCGSILPVELLSFGGEQQNNQVILQWITVNEINFSHFTLESSIDGRSFRKLLQVENPSDVSATMKYYEARDYILNNKTTYYRLKMVDLDGSAEFSKIISFSPVLDEIEVFPNPVVGNFLNVIIPNNDGSEIALFSSNGELLSRITTSKQEIVEIDLSDLTFPGHLIIVEVHNSNRLEQFKILFTE